ncbi:hypothetical protein TWF281_002382 [Arthrobotrys megalospora]
MKSLLSTLLFLPLCIAFPTSTPQPEDPTDPTSTYLILLTANETRPWPSIFSDMGFDPDDSSLKPSEPTTYSFGKKVGHIRTFGSRSGNHSGTRGFTIKIKESEAEALEGAEGVGVIEKNTWIGVPDFRKAGMKVGNMSDHGVTFGFVGGKEGSNSRYTKHLHQKRQQFFQQPGFDPNFQFQQPGFFQNPNQNFNQNQPVQRQPIQPQQPPQIDIRQQSTAPWNLGRLSSATRINPNGRDPASLGFVYQFDGSSGEGVDVYMLDTGMNVQHEDFGGRAQTIFSAFGDDGVDNAGHGTHTAGTVGSLTYGVAKRVNLLNVKVLEPTGGSLDAVIQGINTVINRHTQRQTSQDFKGSIISMSLGAPGLPQAMLQALSQASQAGVHISVAAGNENSDGCQAYPGGFSRQVPLINVGAIDVGDNKASFSNWGDCVDVHAPGTQVLSTWNNGPRGTNVIQGTSMACPAVTGLIANMLVERPDLKLNPAGMKELIVGMGARVQIPGASGGAGYCK